MYRFVTAVSVLLLASPALAGDFDSGSDGTDLALDCAALFALNPECGEVCDQACTVQIDLALAPNAPWDTPSLEPGKGVYDADEWAVVFKYTTIDIPAGVTVTFHNHPKGAPVMWLATGNVTIAGSVRLDGADGSLAEGSSYAIPGPGGFSGGIGRVGGSAGFGPGGGGFTSNGSGGGYGSAGGGTAGGAIYGTPSIEPLIGGSGGGADSNPVTAGGAGGGAILIASSETITLLGEISANGGVGFSFGGSGSGGGIRLVANQISGLGMLRALGGTPGAGLGGFGRIRVEATSDMLVDRGDPPFTTSLPGLVFPEADAPSLRVTAINGKPVPVDPLATVVSEDVAFTTELPVTIEIEGQNVPLGLFVTVRIVQGLGGASSVILSDTPLEGTLELSTTTAQFTFPTGAWEVQLSVQLP